MIFLRFNNKTTGNDVLGNKNAKLNGIFFAFA